MNIVSSTADDVTLQEAALLAERSTKTLRRAVQDGHLERRYVLGPRGPQLVFNRTALLAWLGSKAARRHTADRGSGANRLNRQDYASLVERVSHLHDTLDEIRSTVVHLSAKLQEQDLAIAAAQVTIAGLVGRLNGHEDNADHAVPGALLDALPSVLLQ